MDKKTTQSKLLLVAIIFVIASMVLSGCGSDIPHPVYLKSPSEKPVVDDFVGVWRLHDMAITDVKRYSEIYLDDGFLLLKNNNTFVAHNLPMVFDIGKIEYKNYVGTWSLVLKKYGWVIELTFIDEKSFKNFYSLYIHGDKPYFLTHYILDPDYRPCIVFTLESRQESYCQMLCADSMEAH